MAFSIHTDITSGSPNIADDAMADKAMELEPNLFNKLPRRFRTPERLIHTLEVKREINSYNFILRTEPDDERGLYGTGQKGFVLP